MSLKKYCGIPIYLEKVDSKLYDAIYSMCATGFLIARKPYNGCTFIHPAEGSLAWNTIVSGSPEEALRVLKSLTVMANISGKSGKFVNKNFNTVEFDGSTITVGDTNIRVSHDKKFSPSQGKDLSVYHYDGKEVLPSVGLPKVEDVAAFMATQKIGGVDRTLREKADIKTLHRKNTIAMRETYRSGRIGNIYVECVLSYMKWAEKMNPSYFTSNCQFRALTGNPMVDYFTVLQLAYDSPDASHVENIHKWLSDTNGVYFGNKSEDMFLTYINLYNSQLAMYEGSNVDHQEVISTMYNQNAVGFTKQLTEMYVTENSGDRSRAVRHAWHDEMRLIGNELYRRFLKDLSVSGFSDYEATMRNTCEPSREFSELLCFKEKSSPDYHISTALKFARSGAALFVPKPIKKLSPEELAVEKTLEVVIGDSKQVSLDRYSLWKIATNFSHPAAKPTISYRICEIFA